MRMSGWFPVAVVAFVLAGAPPGQAQDIPDEATRERVADWIERCDGDWSGACGQVGDYIAERMLGRWCRRLEVHWDAPRLVRSADVDHPAADVAARHRHRAQEFLEECVPIYAAALARAGAGDDGPRDAGQHWEVAPADRVMQAAKRSNLRSGPGTGHDKVGLLEVGEQVRVTGEVGDWLRIEAPGGGEAFIYGPLLAEAAPDRAATASGEEPAESPDIVAETEAIRAQDMPDAATRERVADWVLRCAANNRADDCRSVGVRIKATPLGQECWGRERLWGQRDFLRDPGHGLSAHYEDEGLRPEAEDLLVKCVPIYAAALDSRHLDDAAVTEAAPAPETQGQPELAEPASDPSEASPPGHMRYKAWTSPICVGPEGTIIAVHLSERYEAIDRGICVGVVNVHRTASCDTRTAQCDWPCRDPRCRDEWEVEPQYPFADYADEARAVAEAAWEDPEAMKADALAKVREYADNFRVATQVDANPPPPQGEIDRGSIASSRHDDGGVPGIPDQAMRERVGDWAARCQSLRVEDLIPWGLDRDVITDERRTREFLADLQEHGGPVASAREYLETCAPAYRLARDAGQFELCSDLARTLTRMGHYWINVLRETDRYPDTQGRLGATEQQAVEDFLRTCVRPYAAALDGRRPGDVPASSDDATAGQTGPLHGSIAFSQHDDGGYAWGIAWSFGTSVGATAESIDQCHAYGGTECREVGWFQEACGALAIGDGNGYGTGWGDTTAAAERDALAQCRAENQNCRIEIARCSQSEQAGGQGRTEGKVVTWEGFSSSCLYIGPGMQVGWAAPVIGAEHFTFEIPRERHRCINNIAAVIASCEEWNCDRDQPQPERQQCIRHFVEQARKCNLTQEEIGHYELYLTE